MKKTPNKKSGSKKKEVYETIELPCNNEDMESYIKEHRVEINRKIVNTINYALRNHLGAVEVFSFKNSNFVVVLNRKYFKESLENILEFSLGTEDFDTCVKAKSIIKKIDKLDYMILYKKIK
jgi:hypothetical protein